MSGRLFYAISNFVTLPTPNYDILINICIFISHLLFIYQFNPFFLYSLGTYLLFRVSFMKFLFYVHRTLVMLSEQSINISVKKKQGK